MPGLTVALTDPRVSRRHAEVYVDSLGQLHLRDLRSRNGTFINGTKVDGNAPLRSGSVVRVGNTELTLTEVRPAIETARNVVLAAYTVEDRDTRAVPFESLARAALEVGDAGARQGHPERAVAGLLYALARSVAGLREPEAIVDAVIGITADVLSAERAGIYESDERGGLRVLRGAEGGRAEDLEPIGASATLIWRAHRMNQAVLYDARRAQPDLSVSSASLAIRSAIAVPLRVGDQTTGVLYADTHRDEHPLGDIALELLGAVALQAAASLQAARQHQAVEQARTELDEANTRLTQWGLELERRVHERTEEIARQKTEIEELLADKNDVLRMVAHDLRMPLQSVCGYAQLVEIDLDAQDLEGARERLGTIVEIGRRTAYLLDDLLTAESIRTGQLQVNLRAFEIRQMVERTIESVSPQAAERAVTLRYRIDAGLDMARLDPNRVCQVLDNLVLNAIKALGQGGEVTITAAREGTSLVLGVQDNGPGLAPEAGSEPGAPGDPATPSPDGPARVASTHGRGGRGKGFGLGLSIARKLARLVGGELTLVSRPGEGTLARLTLPDAFRAEPGESELAAG